jgi:hypothetical protein
VVEHYLGELSTLCEAIAWRAARCSRRACAVLLAKALVQVRALAAEAMRDREGVRYIARLRVLGELSSATRAASRARTSPRAPRRASAWW